MDNNINKILTSLLDYIEREELSSYDWWDIWGTSYGQYAKRIYFSNILIGIIVIIPIYLMDLIYPNFRKCFVNKRTFPICTSHVGIGYLNLYIITGRKQYFEKAEQLVDPLLKMASPHSKYLAWGMKHKWMTIDGLVPPDTPCHTQTAYSYELFISFYDITKDEKYLHYLREIAIHENNEFYEVQDGDKLAASYSTADKRLVVNANSYRMWMLLDAGIRFDNEDYLKKGMETIRYLLFMQNEDGSWPYSAKQEFVDNYHTCFVLKNLIRTKKLVKEGDLLSAIDIALEKGVSYFINNLFDKKGFPIPFSVEPRFTFYKYDCYDLAESLNLFAELGIDEKKIDHLLKFTQKRFQTKYGWMKFRINKYFPFVKGIPYMRYANSAMFLALTKTLVNSTGKNND